MSENSANSKRIAKNTLMLYFRMLLMMGVTLYTSRVVLNALGVENYGIYNVVGGVVAMFTMISGSLSGAITRFITVELGKGNQERLNTIFSTSVIIQIIIGIIIAILVETVGVWFLVNKMVIPPDKLLAAKWVLQFSLITIIINLISIPYNAAIIAHERMSAFAYISILEAISKLAIAYFIMIAPIDKLIFYAILMACVALIIRFTYSIYCRRHFEECKFRWILDKQLLKEMFSFAGWNFIGTSAHVLRVQGGNMLLNMLGGGPAVNAAKGISVQVNSAIMQFSSNFMTAINPQIIKSYASGNRKYMMTLIFQGSKLSVYMLFVLSLPVLVRTEYILSLWLEIIPKHTVLFVQLALIYGIVDAVSVPLITAMHATGNVRKYQIIVGGIVMCNVPISYFALKLGCIPEIVMIVAILLAICCLVARLLLLRGMIQLSVMQFVKNVILNILLTSFCASLIPYLLSLHMRENVFSFILITLSSFVCSIASIYFIGCNKMERIFIKNKISKIVKQLHLK